MKIYQGSLKKLLLLALLFFSLVANAAAPFKIKDIRIEGLHRISAGTLFNYLPLKVGDQLNDKRSAESIRALFRTGFFKDVKLEREGDVLVIWVTERPAISDIDIKGNSVLETDPLKESLKQIGLAEGRVFDRSLLDRVKRELKRQYFNRGYYAVEVEVTTTPLDRNRTGILIRVEEGDTAKIREINFAGNNAFDKDELLDVFSLTTPTLMSWWTKVDRYSRQKLSADLEALRSFYLNQGFVKFAIESTQVTISKDQKEIFITVNVHEGKQYKVSEIKVAGNLVVPATELKPLIEIKSGDLFQRKLVSKSNDAIADRLGEDGYAFANINLVPELNEEKSQVALTFFIDPGKRVYVNRINISGNTKTRDEVIRRELRQFESGRFSTNDIERSKIRLQKLGFFESVAIETPAVPGAVDKVDVDVAVTEKSTGNLMAGAGYSQTQGFVFNTSVSQDNFLGTGKKVGLEFDNSDVSTRYGVNYNDPYFTTDGVSLGLGAYYSETDSSDLNVAGYSTDVLGMNINSGVPINEYDRIVFGLNVDSTDLTCGSNFTECNDFITSHGANYETYALTGRWGHDSRNKAIFPDRGIYQSASAEFAVPGSDIEYYKAQYKHDWFYPVSENVTLLLKGDVAYGDSYGDTTDLPFFKKYYAGGMSSVRGYKDNTLGPDASTGDPLGGNFRTVANAELILPVPFIKDSGGFRLSGFVDMGNVFAKVGDFKVGDVRASTGVSAKWLSPVGPLTFSLAAPLNDESVDDTETFQFMMGRMF